MQTTGTKPDHLRISGRLVADIEVAPGLGRSAPDRVMLFSAPAEWTLLAIRRHERYGEDGEIVDARAEVWSQRHTALSELRHAVERTWGDEGWWELLEAGHNEHPDLHAEWVPRRMSADLDSCSLYNRDLALASGLLNADPLPGPGRALPDWQSDALQAMAAHLEDRGWRVLKDRPEVIRQPERDENPIVGALRVQRYGYEAVLLVRVDSVGEIHPRVAEESDVAGSVVRSVGE